MNDFFNGDGHKLSLIIKKDSNCNSKTMLKDIDNVFPPSKTPIYNILYVYYLVKKNFKYPANTSNVLYIGCTKSELNKGLYYVSFRFKHLRNGEDKKQNITLSYYYERNEEIGLDIFVVENCIEVEKKLRFSFLKKFCSLPIADGCSYRKN